MVTRLATGFWAGYHGDHVIKVNAVEQKYIIYIIIWPVRPRTQFPWKTIREKVPYEGRTRRSDRTGKTRTALLETLTAKSMWVNDKNNFFCCQILFSQKWVTKVNILLLQSRRIVQLSTSVANSLRKQRKKFNTSRKWRSRLTTLSEANKRTGGQGNNFSG